MSYEGYERVLCANGHLHEFPCYWPPPFIVGSADRASLIWTCPDCNEHAIWWEGVDQTNDEGHPTELKECIPEKTSECKCCGHVKVVEEERYYIPDHKGHRINNHIPCKLR